MRIPPGILAATAALLAGCSGPVPPVADGNAARLALVESNLNRFIAEQIEFNRQVAAVENYYLPRLLTLESNVSAVEVQQWLDGVLRREHLKRLEEIEAVLHRARFLPARPPPPLLSNGIPVSIYNQIVADAVAQWPGDYAMQRAKVRWQVEAYKKLHP